MGLIKVIMGKIAGWFFVEAEPAPENTADSNGLAAVKLRREMKDLENELDAIYRRAVQKKTEYQQARQDGNLPKHRVEGLWHEMERFQEAYDAKLDCLRIERENRAQQDWKEQLKERMSHLMGDDFEEGKQYSGRDVSLKGGEREAEQERTREDQEALKEAMMKRELKHSPQDPDASGDRQEPYPPGGIGGQNGKKREKE